MGVSMMRGSSCSLPPIAFGNPNPLNFKILRMFSRVGWTVAEIQYPDSKNYEGRKILVYHCTESDLRIQSELDPHFCDDRRHVSPFARFEPTERGWHAAQVLISSVI